MRFTLKNILIEKNVTHILQLWVPWMITKLTFRAKRQLFYPNTVVVKCKSRKSGSEPINRASELINRASEPINYGPVEQWNSGTVDTGDQRNNGLCSLFTDSLYPLTLPFCYIYQLIISYFRTRYMRDYPKFSRRRIISHVDHAKLWIGQNLGNSWESRNEITALSRFFVVFKPVSRSKW